MYRRALFVLLIAVSVFALAACAPKPAAPTPAAAMPNPASVYCEQNSGKVELIQDAAGGVAGRCVFADGSFCDEWAYFRGTCQPGDTLTTPDPAASAVPASPSPTAASPSPMPQPSALRVAYAGAGSIMLWTEGVASRQLTAAGNVEQVRISDDGQWVAYLGQNSSGVYELSAVNADGSGQRTLVGQDYLSAIQPAGNIVSFDFAPASHTVYLVTDQYDLHRVDAAAGAPTQIFGAGQGGFFSFSPDGQWMTLYHPNELTLARIDGTGPRVVFQYPEDFRYTMVGPEIIWKPDSSGFNLASAAGPQGSADNMTIWFVPVAGEPAKQMSYTGPYGAHLSPDGQSVVFLDYQREPVEVHVIIAGSKDTLYGSYANVDFMGWAPDSQHFLLNLSEDQRLKAPFVCAVGEPAAQLTDTDDALPVDWIDAGQVLFASHGKALRLQRLGAPSILLDADASSWFDYTTIYQ